MSSLMYFKVLEVSSLKRDCGSDYYVTVIMLITNLLELLEFMDLHNYLNYILNCIVYNVSQSL